jgi:DNA polymerase III delta prime subunit
MKERLICIAQAEGMMSTSNNTTTNGQSSSSSLQENQIDAILQVAGGDMRRAVTSLQSVHALLSGTTTPNGDDPSTSSSSSTTIVVNEALIAELSGLPPDSVIDELYRSFTAPSYDTMAQSVHDCIISNGYSVQTVLQKLLMKITTPPPTLFDDGDGEDGLLLLLLDELGRSRLAIRIAEAEYKMNEGADEYLQLMTVCGLAMQCIQEARRKNSGTRTTVTN